jgi:aspartate/methionine/tyrosine aminotransferase
MEISRRGAVDPFIVMDVMSQAAALEAQGRDVVHMEVGQPGWGAPRAAVEAAAAAMRDQPLGYTVALGLPALRARIAALYADRHGVRIDPGRIAITAGASGAFTLAFLAAFDAGARVAAARPGYPCYRKTMGALGLDAVDLPATPADAFQPTTALLEAAGPLDGLIVASPANPTGAMLDRAALTALARACAAKGAALISDEIYHRLEFDAPAVSALEVAPDAIVINSFSKYYAMTGWRVGWMVVPDALVEAVERLAQNLFICAPHVAQVAALAALDAEVELDAHRAVYRANRDLLLESLPQSGLTRFAPCDGAFYLYADIGALTADSAAFCRRMLGEAGVAATPGLDFDAIEGGRWARFSFAGPTDRMEEGARRLRDWLG